MKYAVDYGLSWQDIHTKIDDDQFGHLSNSKVITSAV
jgi:hypothetical protein